MTARHTSWIAGAMLAAGLAGCRGTAETFPAPAARTAGESAAVAQARADSARRPYTEADIRFMSDMIAHHAQAIEVARWAPGHGANPEVLRLAERIINAQQDEIATMQRWLRERELPVPAATPHTGHHGQLMPGMLTDAQLAQLDQARGTGFDWLFLTFMIQHHRGAVTMVKTLFSTDGAGQDETVFKFASDVNVDQATEIARMQRMLATLPVASPPG